MGRHLPGPTPDDGLKAVVQGQDPVANLDILDRDQPTRGLDPDALDETGDDLTCNEADIGDAKLVDHLIGETG